ncbi:MAG: tellurite resistance TerB family protein, partial [Stellaceae bacterium]
IVGHLPVFQDFDRADLPDLLNDCAELLAGENGIEATLSAIKGVLPARLRETAYAIACDLVAADGKANPDELSVLALLRDRLALDRLVAAALERAARARFQTL